MLALTSATGKLGGAVLKSILDNNFIDPAELVVCTSSDTKSSKFDYLRSLKVELRYNNFEDPSSLEAAFRGCDRVFLVSTPKIQLDFNNAPLWKGREAHHRAAIDAAVKVGVKHIYYTSLAFANPSKAGVMQAHIRTEAYLQELREHGKVEFTSIREGLYNESWPLYFGYYYGLRNETRSEVVVAGDGPIAWTAIADMAFGTAKVLSDASEKWAGKSFYLSQQKSHTLADIARMVSKIKGEEIKLRVVGRKEFEDYYVNEKGMERPSVEWWSSTYDAVKAGETDIKDGTLETILASRIPKPLEDTVKEMMT